MDFYRVKVFGNTDFSGAKFKRDALFRESEFRGRITFSGAVFQTLADFSLTQFLGSADFSQSILEVSKFIGAKFCGKMLSFEGTYFKQYIEFFPSKVVGGRATELTKTRFCYPQPLAEAAKIQCITYEHLGERKSRHHVRSRNARQKEGTHKERTE